ncbi:hypothetical protein ACLOJK_038779 [Asimina triloba]
MVPAVGIVAFSLWGLGPVIRICRNLLLHFVPTSEVMIDDLKPLNYYMGFQFAGKALYSAVWIAAASLFMELLGFSTQKWITAGGLGTLLLTLAGREIFTNFLSSAMIHATRPFVVNEWIQTNIDGYEVSGMVERVGWWSPTIIRGDDREAVHVPNHKFTVNVVRNISQRTHWRIKAQLAISHLDVNKINNIVADMRKVLAKNPHVEQQKLHRRVFLEGIDPENQSLLILVSCFVKTPHVEEYFCVKSCRFYFNISWFCLWSESRKELSCTPDEAQLMPTRTLTELCLASTWSWGLPERPVFEFVELEGILLDLLRVISHHHARLATQIRTIHEAYADTDVENIKFGETIFSNGKATSHRPLLLIEPTYKINTEDKSKAHTAHENEKHNVGEPAMQDSTGMSSVSGISRQSGSGSELLEEANPGDAPAEQGFTEGNPSTDPPSTSTKPLEDLDCVGKKMSATPAASHAKHEKQRPPVAAPPLGTRASLEDNIVLGVALEGSKRTLPIDEGMDVNLEPVETKEVAMCRNGNGSKDKKENQGVSVPGAMAAGEQRDSPESCFVR